MSRPRFAQRTFHSLKNPNYRLWATGAIVSNVGTWMQRTAQFWLVLTQLTDNDAKSLGLVLALQAAPQVILLALTGHFADRLDRRKLIIVTQSLLGMCALILGVLTVSGMVELWHVFLLAFLLGTVNAFDTTARQTFVHDLVGEEYLSNAIALNSSSMTVARLVGPAIAGVLISAIGTGWVFIINAISFVAVVISLFLLKSDQLFSVRPSSETWGKLIDGFSFVWSRPELKLVFIMLFLLCSLGYNFAVYISTMSVSVFHAGSEVYGLLMSMMAVGGLAGALFAAGRPRPTIHVLTIAAGLFGVACLLASMMPNYILFGVTLIAIGGCAQIFNTSANSLIQLSSRPEIRGRVMAILLAVSLGATPVGAPIAGFVAEVFGPRWSLVVGASAGIMASAIATIFLRCHRSTR